MDVNLRKYGYQNMADLNGKRVSSRLKSQRASKEVTEQDGIEEVGNAKPNKFKSVSSVGSSEDFEFEVPQTPRGRRKAKKVISDTESAFSLEDKLCASPKKQEKKRAKSLSRSQQRIDLLLFRSINEPRLRKDSQCDTLSHAKPLYNQ